MIRHNDANDYRINNKKTTTCKSFDYKTKIIGKTSNDNTLDTEVVVPLKYLSNFWRSLHLPLINYEIELDLPLPRNIKNTCSGRKSIYSCHGSNRNNWSNISNTQRGALCSSCYVAYK